MMAFKKLPLKKWLEGFSMNELVNSGKIFQHINYKYFLWEIPVLDNKRDSCE